MRLTDLAAANALGEKLPMLVIGKSTNPRCFKNIKSLPCKNRNQAKSWIDSNIFTSWVKELDRKIIEEGRKIVMIVDNCPAHPHPQLVFLPPNTTSKLEPKDQGVILLLKAKYRSAVVQLFINRIESGKGRPKLNILDVMKFLVQAWNKVNNDTIKNCFKHVRISSAAQIDALEENDDPFKSLQSDLDELRTLDQTLVHEETTAEEYTDPDQALGVAESITIDDNEIFSKYK